MPKPIVRPATPDDVEAILDLLCHYGVPRSDFEPWYYRDPTYRPWQSFILERDGELLCHARLFIRTMRLAGRELPIAGIGNVITATHARGNRYSHRVLDAALRAAEADGYAYSLLWTHLPALYAGHGFTTVEELNTVVQPHRAGADFDIRPATADDVPALTAADERFNASRTGPIRMTPSLWCATRQCTGAQTLLHRSEDGIDGYVRFRHHDSQVEVLDLGVDPADEELARVLLVACVGERPDTPVHLTLPPSLLPVIEPLSPKTRRVHELMGRPLALSTLARLLSWVLPDRLTAAGAKRAIIGVGHRSGGYALEVTRHTVTVHRHPDEQPADMRWISSAELTRFLLRGYPGDDDVLAALFPAQDFVIWPAGRF